MKQSTKAVLQQTLRPGFVLEMSDEGGPFTLQLQNAQGELLGTLTGHLVKEWVLIRDVNMVNEMPGRVVGFKLVSEVEALAIAHGCAVSHVNIVPDRENQRFFETHGYVALEADQSIQGDVPRVYLSRKLNTAPVAARLVA